MATDVMSRLQSPYTGLVNIDTRVSYTWSVKRLSRACVLFRNTSFEIPFQLGEETLSPTFVKHLEHYYDRAPVSDKARCLELITSIKLGEEVKRSQVRRPKTAMPALGIYPYHENTEVILVFKSTDYLWVMANFENYLLWEIIWKCELLLALVSLYITQCQMKFYI